MFYYLWNNEDKLFTDRNIQFVMSFFAETVNSPDETNHVVAPIYCKQICVQFRALIYHQLQHSVVDSQQGCGG